MVAGKPKACPHCLYVPFCAGADWGYHEGVQGDWASCVHITGQRNCQSCSSIWWKLGNDSGWDVDGAPSEDCPECSAFTGRTARGKREILTGFQRRVVAAYLLDRADQYDTESPCWISLSDAASAVVNGEVEAAWTHGELEDGPLLTRIAKLRGKTTRPVEPRAGVDGDEG